MRFLMSTVELGAARVGPGIVRLSIRLEDPGHLPADLKLVLS
jgi:cystathionine beta-lyase/cystathionine gamma-synthase